MRAIIHIGIEKTGTTAIQAFLAANRESLSARGILVPESLGRQASRHLAVMSRDEPETDRYFQRRGIAGRGRRLDILKAWEADWDRELIESDAHLCLMSSEHLHSTLRNDSEIARLKTLLTPRFNDGLKIVVYIRDQLDQVLSARSTALKSGSRSFEIGPASRHRSLDYQELIQRWAAVFGEMAVHTRLYERSTWPEGDLITDFMRTCGLDTVKLTRPSKDHNPRLDALGQRFLRSLNHRLADLGPREQSVLRTGLIAFVEHHFSGGPETGVTDETVADFRAHFAASNEWVRAKFFPERAELFTKQVYPPIARTENDSEIDRLIDALVDNWVASRQPSEETNHPAPRH